MTNKTAIIIAGPTASGKTALAIRLASHLNTEIISADSRQCYREMNIGVAKPTPEELATVPHHFINSHNLIDRVTANTFEQYALAAARKIFATRDYCIIAGGTGLYLKAFIEGLDNIPNVPPAVRENIIKEYHEHGLAWVQEQLKKRDPVFFETGEIKNPHRAIRALEVVLATGRSIRHFQTGQKSQREFDVVKFAISVPKTLLHLNIDARVDHMMQQGLPEEVKSLTPWRQLNALQTVGYGEIFDHLDGKYSLAEATERIKIHTRQYAKRQTTWFRRDPAFRWATPEEIFNICITALPQK